MAVAMRDRWTDERLDDLKASVDDGFRRTDGQFARIDDQFARVEERFDRVDPRLDAEFGRLHTRFDSLSHSIMYGTFALSAAIIAGFVALSVAAL